MLKFLLAILVFVSAILFVSRGSLTIDQQNNLILPPIPFINPTPTPVPLITPPTSKILPTEYHIFQSFNNCGPAALSMALSHYGINKSQQDLGLALRPWQNPQGDNDDKSTTLEEMANKSKEYGFVPFHRPNGSIQLIKQFITYDIPVITRTWLKPNDDIGHYRVVKGYDANTLIQ